MNTPDRETIMRRFSELLDGALAEETPQAGIPEEILANAAEPAGGDLYAVQAALTALAQEVKLQGRSFKQLAEAVAPAMEPLAQQARREARREVLDVLLDLRDRLARGEEAAAKAGAPPRRWWQRPVDPRDTAIVAALREGYRMTSTRLDEVLERFGVREIECAGLPFETRRMEATGIEETDQADEGTVVAVLRRGYEWNGELYRPAQVRVARRPASPKEVDR
jgi:molecular chaperone GrpE